MMIYTVTLHIILAQHYLEREGKKYNLCYEPNRDNHGVEYTETVRFVKTNWEYYLKKPKNEIQYYLQKEKTM